MIESQIFGNFVTTTHFCERWYERTSIPGTYFELVMQESAYVFIGQWRGNDYYMFSCPKDSIYYIFITIENTLKTILTEKMYKNYPNVDLRRAKKQLRQMNKTLRVKWNTFKLSINDYVVHNIRVDGLVEDPIWWHINNYKGIVEFWVQHTETPKIVEMYAREPNIPLKTVFDFKLYIGEELIFEKNIPLSPVTFKKMKEHRECFLDISQPMNRHQKRMLKKMGVELPPQKKSPPK